MTLVVKLSLPASAVLYPIIPPDIWFSSPEESTFHLLKLVAVRTFVSLVIFIFLAILFLLFFNLPSWTVLIPVVILITYFVTLCGHLFYQMYQHTF